jgi:hypothetical protein
MVQRYKKVGRTTVRQEEQDLRSISLWWNECSSSLSTTGMT